MERIGNALKERFEQIIIENEMLRAGFAALPYRVLRDTQLSVGARLAYAVLLMYAWQEGATFAGQAFEPAAGPVNPAMKLAPQRA